MEQLNGNRIRATNPSDVKFSTDIRMSIDKRGLSARALPLQRILKSSLFLNTIYENPLQWLLLRKSSVCVRCFCGAKGDYGFTILNAEIRHCVSCDELKKC